MFKENKEFWLYFLGILAMFFFMFFYARQNVGDVVNKIIGPALSRNAAVPTLVVATPQPTPNSVDTSKTYIATFKTNRGDFKVNLFAQNAPNTVTNFISLLEKKYYDGTKFHRLIPNVLIQGGSRNTLNEDLNDDKFGGPGYTIDDEINWDSLDFEPEMRTSLASEGYKSATKLASKDVSRYMVAMANSQPNSSGSQFFIVLGDRDDPRVDQLRGRHTVFGEVIEGREVIDTFNFIGVDDLSSSSPRPQSDVIINSIEIEVR